MQRQIFLIILALIVWGRSNSQDIITKMNGDKIVCKITKVDSINVYFILRLKGNLVNTYIDKNNISHFQYASEVANNSNPPVNGDSIITIAEKDLIGYNYYFNDKILAVSKLSSILKSNPQAFAKFKRAQGTRRLARFMASCGFVSTYSPVLSAIKGDEVKWGFLGIGAGFLTIMLPILISAENQKKQAIEIYNNGLKRTSMIKKEVRFGFFNNGLGICMRF